MLLIRVLIILNLLSEGELWQNIYWSAAQFHQALFINSEECSITSR